MTTTRPGARLATNVATNQDLRRPRRADQRLRSGREIPTPDPPRPGPLQRRGTGIGAVMVVAAEGSSCADVGEPPGDPRAAADAAAPCPRARVVLALAVARRVAAGQPIDQPDREPVRPRAHVRRWALLIREVARRTGWGWLPSSCSRRVCSPRCCSAPATTAGTRRATPTSHRLASSGIDRQKATTPRAPPAAAGSVAGRCGVAGRWRHADLCLAWVHPATTRRGVGHRSPTRQRDLRPRRDRPARDRGPHAALRRVRLLATAVALDMTPQRLSRVGVRTACRATVDDARGGRGGERRRVAGWARAAADGGQRRLRRK